MNPGPRRLLGSPLMMDRRIMIMIGRVMLTVMVCGIVYVLIIMVL
jgi:hypothetical protein